jgi:DNA-binding NtrC family response regulator
MCHITVPPLRERKKDILPLARHFLKRYSLINKKQIVSLAPDLAERLQDYHFPGNVRELENVIAAAVLFEEGEVLTLSSTRDLIPLASPSKGRNGKPPTLAEVEKEYIAEVMDMTKGNRTKAAKILGIGLRTLQRKLKAMPEAPSTPK